MRILAPWNDRLAEPLRQEHLVQLYREEAAVVEAVALFTSHGLGKGDAVILIATPAHREAVRRRLQAVGFVPADLEMWSQLLMEDAATLLSRIYAGGRLDDGAFRSLVGGLVLRARDGGRHPRVRVYGEMVDLLWGADHAAARRLEELWNEQLEAHGLSLLCAYRLGGGADAEQRFPPDLRGLHSHLIPIRAGR